MREPIVFTLTIFMVMGIISYTGISIDANILLTEKVSILKNHIIIFSEKGLLKE